MNSTIKNWLEKTLSLDEQGRPTTLQLSKMKELGLSFSSLIDGLLLSAKTLPEGKIPSKQGMKSIKIHPAIFLANMARKASEISESYLLSDSYLSSVYAYAANIALTRLTQCLDQAQIDSDNSVNDFQDNKDTSLNLIHNVVQVRSMISDFPGVLQDRDQFKRVESFFNGENPLKDLSLDEDLALRTCGVNSYFVAKTLAHEILDFETYLSRIAEFDVNSPYIYRANYGDYLGASICLAQACKHLTYNEKLSLAKDYLALITSRDKSILRLEFQHASTVLPQPNPFAANVPRLVNESSDNDMIVNAVGHAFSYSTALGLSPTAGIKLSVNGDNSPFQSNIAKLILHHTHEATVYAGKLLHSDDVLAKTSEEVQNFTRHVSI